METVEKKAGEMDSVQEPGRSKNDFAQKETGCQSAADSRGEE
jgi:hypothetical protein